MNLWLVDNKGTVLKEWKNVERDICEFTFVMLEPFVGEDIACVIKRFREKKNKKETWFEREIKKVRKVNNAIPIKKEKT